MKNEDIVRIENESFRGDILDIRWRVTSACNYRCAFCIQGDHETHARLSAGETQGRRKEIADRLRTMCDGEKRYAGINVSLIGGEVTILRDFPEILRELAESSFPGPMHFHITTNFSGSAEYYAELAAVIRDCDRQNARRILHLTASFYPAYTSAGAFTEKARRLLKLTGREKRMPRLLRAACARVPMLWGSRISFTFRIDCPVVTEEEFVLYQTMKEELRTADDLVQPLWIREYETALSAETKAEILRILRSRDTVHVTDRSGARSGFESIRAVGAALEGTERFCPKGYLCDAGVHNLWINAFGEAYRCPAIGSEMRMGSILDGSFHFLPEPAVCTSDHCSCSQFGTISAADHPTDSFA